MVRRKCLHLNVVSVYKIAVQSEVEEEDETKTDCQARRKFFLPKKVKETHYKIIREADTLLSLELPCKNGSIESTLI